MSYKLVGLTGPQGCGKSTLLAEIASRKTEVTLDQSTISRDVQAALGHRSLAEAYASVDKMQLFQEMVLAALQRRDRVWMNSSDSGVVLVDRTPLDLMVYAMMWTTKLTGQEDVFQDQWCLDYCQRCSMVVHRNYEVIFTFEPSENIPFASESSRAAAADVPLYMEHFNRVVDGMINR